MPTVMPLGDSITKGESTNGGYRLPLQAQLDRAACGYNFVGSQTTFSSGMRDPEHEGYDGKDTPAIQAVAEAAVPRYRPDVILVMTGVNDVLNGLSSAVVVSRIRALVTRLFALKSDMRIYLAEIMPIFPPYANMSPAPSNPNATITAVNAGLSSLAAEFSASGFVISLVPTFAAMSQNDFMDGVHPTASGYLKLSGQWFGRVGPCFGTNPLPPTQATVQFAYNLLFVTEDCGSDLDLPITIANADATKATSADLVLIEGDPNLIGAAGTLPLTLQTVQFPAGSSAVKQARIKMPNDNRAEGFKVLRFELRNSNGNVGANRQFTLGVNDDDGGEPVVPPCVVPPTLTIQPCGTQQFSAFGEGRVTWETSAPGGSITQQGQFRAGSTAGVFKVRAFDANGVREVPVLITGASLCGSSVDVAISLAAPARVSAGNNASVVVTLRNGGTATANEVRAQAPLPVGFQLVSATASRGTYSAAVWNVGALAAGATETLTLVCRAVTLGTNTYTASVQATTTDPVPANNTASMDITVQAAPKLLSSAGYIETPYSPHFGENDWRDAYVWNVAFDEARRVEAMIVNTRGVLIRLMMDGHQIYPSSGDFYPNNKGEICPLSAQWDATPGAHVIKVQLAGSLGGFVQTALKAWAKS